MYFQRKLAIIVLFLIPINTLYSQSNYFNIITTSIPFLTINPNAQAGGIGEIGVVSSSLYQESGLTQNPALLSRNNMSAGTKISYTPWLRSLVPDNYILDFAMYYSIDSMNTIAGSFSFFNLGENILTNTMGNVVGITNPYDYYFSIRYARTLTKNFSAGVGIKYIFSDLAPGIYIQNYKPIHTYAIDFGLGYRNNFKVSEKSSLRLDFGLAFLNLGPKVKYISSSDAKFFIPAEIKTGAMLTYKHILNNDFHLSFDLAYQAGKLLVPTPPIYELDSTGNYILVKGKDPNVSAVQGMINSFSDAPNGSKEEFNEIIHMFGFEARIINNQQYLVALRAGKFFEHESKGGRNYFTLGAGIGVFGFYFDYSLIPGFLTTTRQALSRTPRFAIGYKGELNNNIFKFIEN